MQFQESTPIMNLTECDPFFSLFDVRLIIITKGQKTRTIKNVIKRRDGSGHFYCI